MLKHSKIRLNLTSNQSGTTLVEVLIAVALLGIVAIAFLSGLGTGFQGAILADERTTTESLARSQLETIRNAEYNDIPPYQYTEITGIPNGYSITISVLPINPETGDISFTDTGLQKIIVTISHGSKPVLQVESYKGNR